MDFLKTLKAPSPVFPNDTNELIFLNSNASITEGFKVLINNNISSVPIYDEGSNTYTASLSLLDVVLHALDTLSPSDSDDESSILLALTNFCDKIEFRRHKAKDIAERSKKSPPVVGKNVSIDQVVDIMVKTKAHHVLVRNENGTLINVITQTRIIESVGMLFEVDPQLTELGVQTVQKLGLGLRDVISVSENTKTSTAFRTIAENGVSGIAVVDKNDVLIGNISTRDLRAIKHDALFIKLLHLPVLEYLEASHKEYGVPKLLVKSTLEDTYRTVMERIVENKVHRCYIVDKADKLLGVITLWDLLDTLQRFSKPNVHAPMV